MDNLHDAHTAQCINYLKISHCRLALLINFHKDLLDHRRIIF
ncbi:GxxExxY protein [Sinomicrobium soli]|nr:GxxExxY protein [Sinomicrobium sp. N-1-3-6]